MVTIYDVAEASGFSPATVSKAFNSYLGVSKKTYDTIMSTAKRMGYTPNSTARALITKKSWLVGMLFSEELSTGIKHPHFSEIFSSAQIRLGKAGYDVVFINNSLGGEEISYLEHCHYRGVDGIFMAASAQFTDAVDCILESPMKMVSVEMTYRQKYSVLSENYEGSITAMEYLYSLGHRKIAHIAAPLYSLAGPERYRAYRDFLESKKLPFDPSLVVESKAYDVQSGYAAALELMDKARGQFSAVFAAYDYFACAAMSCFKAHGFEVPENISIVGFDNLSSTEIAGMTTICQDRERIGRLAADVLIAQMQDKPLDAPFDLRVPTSLKIRSSCRRIG